MIITAAARRATPWIGILTLASVLMLVRSPVRAAPNELSNGTVSPAAGTTDTFFTFTVDYVGTTPSSVSASAGGVTVPLSVISGTPADGTYSGTGQLPAGTHSVVFAATTAQGNDPILNGPQVVVSPGSSPMASPSPTPTPTPIPTPAPTPTTPPPPTQTPRPTPAATTTPPASVTPTPSLPPTPSVPAQSPAATPEQSVLAGTPGSPSAQPPAGPTAGESGPVATGEVGGVAASTAASPGSDPGSGSVGRTEGAAPIAPALATAGILSLIVILGVAHDRRRRALTSDRRPDRMITPDHH